MTEPKQKIEPKLSTGFRKIVTGGSLIQDADGRSNFVARPPAIMPSISSTRSANVGESKISESVTQGRQWVPRVVLAWCVVVLAGLTTGCELLDLNDTCSNRVGVGSVDTSSSDIDIAYFDRMFANALATSEVTDSPGLKFDESEHLPYRRRGTAVIEGQAFLRPDWYHLDEVPAKESLVTLSPATTYTLYWLNNDIPGLFTHANKARSYLKQTRADQGGNFTFDGLPAGDYFLVTSRIHYIIPGMTTRGYGTYRSGYARAYARVSVRRGETIQVAVTNTGR